MKNNIQKAFLLRGLALLMVLGATLPAWAADYVFIYDGGYLAVDNSGDIVYTTTFSPQCVWTCSSNTNANPTAATLGATSRYLYATDGNGTRRWLVGSTTDGAAITTTTTAPGTAYWRNTDNHLNYYSTYARYAYYRENTWRVSRRNNGNSYGVNAYRSGNNNGTDFRSTTYEVTTSSQAQTDNTTSPTISVASFSANTITFSHSNLTGSFVEAYTRYTFNYTTHNYYNGTDYGNTIPSVNANTLNPTYTWSLTANGGGVASINATTGVLTLNGAPTGNITVRLTVSNISPLGNKTVDFTLTRAAIAQNVSSETTLSTPSISPSSAALYYNEGSQAFTSSASATTTTITVPAHTTLTGGGTTYYYYNGTLYTSTDDFSNITETHPAVTLNWALSGAAASYLTRTPASGTSTTVTHSSQSPSDQTATLTVTATATGATSQTATATITAYGPIVAPTITRSGNTITLATTSTGATIYYTTDGSTPTASSTPYTGSFNLTTSPTTVKAIAIRDGHNSTVATETFLIQLAAPVISISNTGLATITAEAGATIHYTTDGSAPTASSPTYSAPVQLTNPQTIMAIAVRANYTTSDIAMDDYIIGGVVGNQVILDDREDHVWSYYSDATLPGQLRSLNPADVRITYRGNGNNVSTSNDANPAANSFTAASTTVRVGIDADVHTFIYNKTLERTDGSTSANPTGRCAYTTIPNPFSVRPTYGNGDTRWRGFYAWRVTAISGGAIYDAATGGNQISVGGTIDAEQTVYLAPTSEYSMQVELEALWARMYVGTGYQASVGYERNYVVGGAAVNFPATYSAIYPNGTTNGTAAANSVPSTYDPGGARTLSYDTKFEYINLTGNRTYTANNHYLCFGRGISTANNAGTVQGINANAADLNYTIRVESGQYSAFSIVRSSSATVSGRYMVRCTMGCDYDRATNTNNKLSISASSSLFFSQNVTFSGTANKDVQTFEGYVKSGSLQSGYWDGTGNAEYQQTFYCGQNGAGNTYPGARYLTIEGGEMGSVCGGRGVGGTSTTYMTPEVITFYLRIKGGLIHGSIYGGAADNPSIGSRRFIITGGEVQGWISGGCNGTGGTTGTGATDGDSYIYVGGDVTVGGSDPTTINGTAGGQVFGAGRGISGRLSSVNHSHVVVADEATVSNASGDGGFVYGGSYNGNIADVSNVYIIGGTVEGKVFGGSYGNGNSGAIPAANITMTGGHVTKGVYGGSNSNGNVGDVTMHIDGGTVGNGTAEDGVYGGGYGGSTNVTGDVNVTLGASTSVIDSATVNGNVYGGSALGNVNTNANNTTTVTMNKALINGNLFGGAYGEGAVVNGLITVNVHGGRVNGNVFGGGDAAAYGRNNQNYPIVNMTGGKATNVFGGGKGKTAGVTGNPQVTLSGTANITGNIYGGGDAASVTGNTSVILQD